MRHLIVGDIHGFHTNLRDFLTDVKVIDAKGNRINRDNYKVYSVGDLIDGDYNREGDLLNLAFAEEWFDNICIGNHEFAFLGGKDFGTRRKHDRKTMSLLLQLIDKGIYVPSILVDDTLVTHAGLSDKFQFTTAADAYEYIRLMWELAPDIESNIAVFDWGVATYNSYSYAASTDGIFQLDWIDKRNSNFAQVVGHSTYYTGPVRKVYDNDIVHWNVDVGAKTGICVGGIVIDDVTKNVEVLFHGSRNESGFTKIKKTYPPKGEVMTFDPKAEHPVVQNLLPIKSESLMMKQPSTKPTGNSTTALTTKQEQQLKILPITDIDDIDIALITDPVILAAYRKEIREGRDVRLRDFVEEFDLQ